MIRRYRRKRGDYRIYDFFIVLSLSLAASFFLASIIKIALGHTL